MKTRFLLLAALFSLPAAALVRAEKPHEMRYVGEWSDGRGVILTVAASKFHLGSHASAFKEIYRSADERFFRLQITSGGGGFDGRFLRVEVGREEMQMREYRTLADCLNDRQVAAVIAWSRDR